MKAFFLSLSILFCLMQQARAQAAWVTLLNPSSYDNFIYGVQVQPDSNIVVAGKAYIGAYEVIAIGRLNAGGETDASFGSDGTGMVMTLLDSANTVALAIELQQDGKIVVAGKYQKGSVQDFILARYTPDGTLDSSFGLNGIVRTDINPGTADEATALAIQPDGKILAAGSKNSFLAVCRYHTDGALDSSFGTFGKMTAALPGATCMKLQANGKIVVGCDTVVTRLLPDGSPDLAFGTDGITDLTSHSSDIAIQNDGKMLLTGKGHPPGEHYQFTLERLDTAGIHDPGFGVAGLVTTDGFIPMGTASNPAEISTSVCLQPDGRILASGYTRHGLLADHGEIAVARYFANGIVDSSFATNGRITFDVPGFFDNISYAAVINHNNQLVVTGTSDNEFGSRNWLLVAFDLGPSLGISNPEPKSQISISPNPAENMARLQATHLENGTWHLSLSDFTGRVRFSETVVVTDNALDKSISLAGLPAGTYLVKLDNGVRRMAVKLAKCR